MLECSVATILKVEWNGVGSLVLKEKKCLTKLNRLSNVQMKGSFALRMILLSHPILAAALRGRWTRSASSQVGRNQLLC